MFPIQKKYILIYMLSYLVQPLHKLHREEAADMTGRQPVQQRGGGKGVLFVVALVLAAGVIKYTNTPFTVTVRQKAAEIVAGMPQAERILEVLGGKEKNTPVSEVFGEEKQTAYAISSGGADDILGREKTLFPDTVDQTVHQMKFTHNIPTEGVLTATFGSRLSPVTGQPGFHYGLDIAADEGEKIGAFADGTVREIGESSYGKYVILDHADGFATLYAHCADISVQLNDTVECGEEIAQVGQTGNVDSPHLHLELWKDGMALDPANYLTGL